MPGREGRHLLAGIALLLSSTARAEPPAPPAGAPGGDGPAETVVTGSRIRRSGPAAMAPVRVISRDEILASGRPSIADFLRTLPEQGNALHAGVNAGGDGSARVNLRGIGASRTLVLVNGRRWMPGGGGADGSVDLTSIPSAVVERIEVLTDGASAVYGSDAIAGVVNVVTRTAADGIEASLQTGASGRADGATVDVSLTAGLHRERGSVLLSAGWLDQRQVMAGDRAFSSLPYFYDATGDSSISGRTGRYSAGSGTIPAGRTLAAGSAGTGNLLWNDLVGAGGSSFVRDPGPAGPGYEGTTVFCGPDAAGRTPCFRRYMGEGLREAGDVGDGYNDAPESFLVAPQQRVELFGTGELKLGSAARAFVEGSYVNRRSSQRFAPGALVLDALGVSVSAGSVYNPFGLDVFVRRRLVELGPLTTREDVDAFRVLGGVDGTAPDGLGPLAGWRWDVTASFGRTAADTTRPGLRLPALANALGPSFLDGGVARCGTPQAPISGCVPLDLFGGPGSITPDQLAGLAVAETTHGTNALGSIQANASGGLFRLAADRPVALAAGYEHRELSGSAAGVEGSFGTDEAYAELSVPVVSGRPALEDLEATAAIRLAASGAFGSDTTYGLGARWSPVAGVALRGTVSTAFRAPGVAELYAAPADTFVSASDPCASPANATIAANCGAAAGNGDTSTLLHSVVGGNPDLAAETATTTTLGLVLEPRWARALSVSVGYWALDVDGLVGAYGESVLLRGCYAGTNPEYCSRIVRDPTTGFIDTIVNLNANVGRLRTSGVDVAVRYALPAPRLGRFAFALDATWLQRIDRTLPDGTVVKGRSTFDLNALNSSGGAGGTFPEWKLAAALTWTRGGLGAGLATRYVGGFHECGDSGGDFSGSGLCYVDATWQRPVSSWHAEDAFLSYAFRSRIGRTTVAAGVQNLLDRDPAAVYDGVGATDPYASDPVGRFLYVRLAQRY